MISYYVVVANTIRDLVLTFVGAALAAGGVTYIVPNRK